MKGINEFNRFDNIPDFWEVKQKSIQEIMQNEDIYSLLLKNGKNQKYVENHWITFLNYFEDIKACKNCQGLVQCNKPNRGMIQELDIKEEPMVSLTACKYGDEIMERQRVLSHVVLKNVSNDIVLTNMAGVMKVFNENKEQNLFNLTDQFIEHPNGKGLFIYGKPGCGKSSLAGFIIRNLANKGHTCGYIHFPIYLMDLKNSFNDSGNDRNIDDLKTVDFLVIDDLGGENVTTWTRDEVLSTIVAYRYQNRKATIFTSQFNKEELIQIYTLKSKDFKDKMRVERLLNTVFAMALPIELKSK